MNKAVLCFGELLLRMSPALEGAWIDTASMPVYIGGAELNVAQALAKWGLPVKYVSALPDHYLSEEILNYLRKRNIDCSAIRRSGDRIGTYYLPQGLDLKNAGVIYDRANSSFAQLKPGDLHWETILKKGEFLHFSAICPALNAQAAQVCSELLEQAARNETTISIDLNYRPKLWQYGVAPDLVMPQLVKHAKVLMGNLWAVEKMLGIPSPIADSMGIPREELIKAAEKSIDQVMAAYPQLETIAYTFRLQKTYFGIIRHQGQTLASPEIKLDALVDKVGSGDCFMAGLLYGLYKQQGAEEIINFAAAAAVNKLYETGDATQSTVAAIQQRFAEIYQK